MVLFPLFDGGIKLVPVAPVTDTMTALGWPDRVWLARGLGVLTLARALL